MRIVSILLLAMLPLTVVGGETFYLKSEQTGRTYGPFKLEFGAKVQLGKVTLTIVPEPDDGGEGAARTAADKRKWRRSRHFQRDELGKYMRRTNADLLAFLGKADLVDYYPDSGKPKRWDYLLDVRDGDTRYYGASFYFREEDGTVRQITSLKKEAAEKLRSRVTDK